jgi:hypothetical protein
MLLLYKRRKQDVQHLAGRLQFDETRISKIVRNLRPEVPGLLVHVYAEILKQYSTSLYCLQISLFQSTNA